jgi:multidrug efflux system membrane fusion protein
VNITAAADHACRHGERRQDHLPTLVGRTTAFLNTISRRSNQMRGNIVVVALGVAAAVGSFTWYQARHTAASAQAPAGAPASVPVLAATAQRRNVPVYLDGLGTVQAFNTVTVRVRVDGELQKVAFTEGQEVKAGDLLAQIDPRPFQAQLDQAEAKKVQDQAQLANAKLDLQRYVELSAREFATRQSVDTQHALVAQLEATVRGDQAMIDNAKIQLGYTTITAPLDGRTGIRLVDQGNIVHATDPTGLVVITQLQPISVIFTLPEENLPAIAKATAAGPLKVQTLSRDQKTLLGEGTVLLVDNQIDQTTGTVRLKATFPNLDHALWPGQFINARLELAALRQVVTVPAGAIQRGANGTFAYVIKPDRTVDMRPVTVGQIGDGVAVIAHGIAAGEPVVTSGQYRLQPGTRVETKVAAATSPGVVP